MSDNLVDNYWERIHGYISEHPIDVRYILRSPNDDKAWGSLRIVGYNPKLGILPPGYLRAEAIFVTKRLPKNQQEIQKSLVDYQMDEIELEVYSVDENVLTDTIKHDAPKREIEEMFGVKIFGK